MEDRASADDEAVEVRRPTICLTMIVRNEAHIVTETLESVAPWVDTWSIVDTGSDDGTQELIREFFDDRGIPGTLHERPWVGFAHNRTDALDLACGTADYSFMMDADDLLVGTPAFDSLGADGYLMRLQGSGTVYWRTQLFSQSRAWEYRGAVHEYAVCPEEGVAMARLGGDHHIEVRHLGDRNVRGDKYERDTDLLRAALEIDPADSRSVFYLAQTRLHAGDPQEAFDLYTQRTTMGGWEEEIHQSHLQRAHAADDLGEPWERVLPLYLEAWNFRPTRNEPLVEIARRYRALEQWSLAHAFASLASEIPLPTSDVLFVSMDSHLWQASDERAIAAFYVGRHRESFDLCNELLSGSDLPLDERDRVLANREHAALVLLDAPVTHPHEIVSRMTDRPLVDATSQRVTLTITTCKRRDLFEQTMDSFLSHGLDGERIDRGVCIDEGSSPEDLDAMEERYPFLEIIEKDPRDRGHARSMQLLRDEVRTPYWLHLEDDWRFIVADHYIARALDILEEDDSIAQVLFNRNYAESLDDRMTVGGEVRRTAEGDAFRLHVHLDPTTVAYHAYFAQFDAGSASCTWWPHFSLRPSLMRTESIRAVGDFDVHANNFELEFARRFATTGQMSAFFDTITCLHTGPLTRARGVARRSNAYDLNRQLQFGSRPAATVHLVGNWADPRTLRAHFERQSMGDGRWNDLRLVDDPESADVTVVLNHPGPLAVDPSRTILMHMEPNWVTTTWGPWGAPDSRSFVQVRSHANQPNVAEWHLDATWAELGGGGSRGLEIVKSRDLSTITSDKYEDPGQRLRVDFIRHLVANGVEIDVFGDGSIDGVPDHRGPLPPADKRGGLFPYRYTFAAENNAEFNYVTEKLFDAILSETLCFYWGCPNLEELVDPEAFVRLPLDDFEASRAIIERAIADDLWSERLPALRAEKQRILDEYQLFPTIERAIRGAQMLERLPIKVVNLDRRPDRWDATQVQLAAALDRSTLDRVERVRAIDGLDLEMTAEIEHLFRGNDFHFRRGMIGCALTHLEIWRDVAQTGELTLVLEDDITLVPDFRGQLIEVLAQLPDPRLFDIAYLGAFRILGSPDRGGRHPRQRWSTLSWNTYGGGTFAYLLTPDGARTLLRIVEEFGIQTGIDWVPKVHPTKVHALECTPDLVRSVAAFAGFAGDSDIQHDWVSLPDRRTSWTTDLN